MPEWSGTLSGPASMRPRDTTAKEGGSAGHAGAFTGPYLTSMEGGNASSMSGKYFALYMPRSKVMDDLNARMVWNTFWLSFHAPAGYRTSCT